ncbi:MAG: efflux RND transporter permease subunit [Bacteroidota bacterium]
MPVVMIITLFSSLFVAYVINPVFAVSFMKQKDYEAPIPHRQVWTIAGGLILTGILAHLGDSGSFGTFLFFIAGFVVLNAYVLRFAIDWFQLKAIPSVKEAYRNTLRWSLDHPIIVSFATVGLIFGTMFIVQLANLKFIQFPSADPNFVYVYNELPNGTEIEVTDSVTRYLETKVREVVDEDNPIVKSIITNVAIGAGDANSFDQSSSAPHKGKVTVEFVGVKERNGASTQKILDDIRDNIGKIPGAKVTVAQDANGPPGSAPIEILITSEDFGEMMDVSEGLMTYLDSLNIPGVEQLKWDVDEKRPEILVQINRAKASELGLSSAQIGTAIRTALFGKEVSQYRTLEDEFPIQLRLDEGYRNDISALLDMRITYMDQSNGRFKSVPISSVADIAYSASYGGINRTDLKKSVTITSNVLNEYNVNDVAAEAEFWVNNFIDKGRSSREVDIEVGGQTKDMAEEGAFLGGAFGAAILLIFMILVTQFNSLSNVLIIISQVFLSILGVFIGHALLGMEFSVVLSGVGLVVLAGIVVNNGIILLDYIQILRRDGYSLREAVIEGGATRFTPVLLTASSTMLGLVPLAFSFNINFGTLLSELDPQIFFGGDSAAFWEPLSWSIIFGLSFATLITLVFVPFMYFYVQRFLVWFARKFQGKEIEDMTAEADGGEEPVPYSEEVYSNGHSNGHSSGNGYRHSNGSSVEEETEDGPELVN